MPWKGDGQYEVKDQSLTVYTGSDGDGKELPNDGFGLVTLRGALNKCEPAFQ